MGKRLDAIDRRHRSEKLDLLRELLDQLTAYQTNKFWLVHSSKTIDTQIDICERAVEKNGDHA